MRLALVLSLFVIASLTRAEEDPSQLRLHQIQVVGTHNSYHVRPPEALLRSVIRVQSAAKEWDYTREPLDKQLERGIRSFELDMHCVNGDWHVMHVPVLDPGSTVKTFKEAIILVKSWSDKHPRHIPVSFLMELKEEGILMGGGKGIKRPEKDDVLRLDEIIRDVFPPERLLTPDDVRGKHKTLNEAIQAKNWPTLNEAAGKVFFILHETGPNRRFYLDGHPALEGRAMFVESTPGEPHAAVLVLNNPTDPEIAERANEGYLVRTRVDGQGSIRLERREAGMKSGAHILTTDYPIGEIDQARAFHPSTFTPARGNPITAPEPAREQAIAEPVSK